MKGKLPVSKAKTAYGLLSEIAALVVAEPLRYDQGRFISVRDENTAQFRKFPECGTVGCVAGWVAVLRGPNGVSTPYDNVETTAADILGLSWFEKDELFDGAALASRKTHASPTPQTIAHAKAGARHIRRFQKKYRTQLLAKKLGAK